MAPTTAPAPPPPPSAPPPPPFGPDSRRFRRSVDDRWFGGVAGGLASSLGVDANLVRIGLMVLGVFSMGAAVVGYAAACLLVPDTTEAEPAGARWLRQHGPGGERPLGTVALVVLGVLLAATVGAVIWGGDEGPLTLLLVVGIAAVGFAAHRDRGDRGPDGTRPPGPPPPGGGGDDDPVVAGAPPEGPAARPTALVPWSDAPTAVVAEPDPRANEASTRRRNRRIARNVTVIAALEAAAVTGALWATETGPVPGWMVPASVLGVLIVGLASAPLWGWSWSVAILAVLTVPFLLLAAVPGVSMRGGVGYRSDHPTAIADLPERYRLGIGHQEIDLTDLDLVPGTTTVVRLGLGVGEAEVRVPDDVELVLRGHLGGGAVFLDGEEAGIDGSDIDLRRTYPARDRGEDDPTGSDGRDQDDGDPPVLVIDAEIGAGSLELHREAA